MNETSPSPKNSGSVEPKPSIGRVVHFEGYGYPDTGCLAAIVTGVSESDPTVIDLFVMKKMGTLQVEGVHQGTREGQWHWPERV